MGKNYKYILATEKDRKFNKFLDMTIIGTAYNYFNENRDFMNMEEYKDDIVVNCPAEVGLFDEVNNRELRIAMKSLTKNERLVISFVFEDKLKGKEIAKKMKINANTVYIIKKRAINKLEKLIKEIRKNGTN